MRKLKKITALALAGVCLTACGGGKSATSTEYSTDEILSASRYDVNKYVKLCPLDNIKITVTGDYDVTDQKVTQYIDSTLSSKKPKTTASKLTDTYVKRYLGYDSVKKYRDAVKANIASSMKQQKVTATSTTLISYLKSHSKIEIPSGYTTELAKNDFNTHKQLAKDYKMPFKKYISTYYNQKSEKAFLDYLAQSEENTAKENLACQALIKESKTTVTKKEFSNFVKQYVKTSNTSEKAFYKKYGGKKKVILSYAQNKAIVNLSHKVKVTYKKTV